ncbi:hypothetical protein EKO04_009854 [Ascochyta lentis]|uniref:Ankyrin n=1 Tax=Ascochyta lentis TaxID=205686 RepID=A0A8H7IXQ5_9PLEO|nr:hypothetical protein EKO04_009854 [Ascochyta lentis]
MRFCACASPESPVDAPRPSLHGCDERNKNTLAPRRLVRKPSKLQTTVEVTRCRFGTTSRQVALVGCEDFNPQKDWPPIYHAVYNGREAALHHFLQNDVSPDDTTGTGVPLLCIAAARGHFEIAKILLEAGAAINTCSEEKGETALHIATRGNQRSIIDLLLGNGADLEAATAHTGETPLHYAAAGSSSLVLVMKLLKSGAKYDAQNLDGQTPAAIALQAHNLHAAVAIINMARGKRTQLAKEKDMLLQHVEKTKDRSSMTNDLIADVFAATCDPDSTVLIEAIKKNDAGLVEMFLEKGADPHRATVTGLLPIFVAVKFADLRIVKLLVQHGADIEGQGPGNLNLLQVLFKTCSKRSEESIAAMLEYLLAKGAFALALYPDGKTLLHRAVTASQDHAKVVKLLLEHGINVNAQDDIGNTALHLAAINGLAKTTDLLLNAHADSTINNSTKQTPLLCAVQNQQWPIVPPLAVSPATASWDAEGSTALHHIARSIPGDSTTWTDIAAAVKPFCERDICRSLRDRSGATPLIQAVRTLPEEGLLVVETLLTEGGKQRNCIGHEDHKGRNALYYAATLGKLVFVETLLKHGAAVVLEDWANCKRQSKLPADTKERTLELITNSDRLRQAKAVQNQPCLDRETRIEIILPEQRSNSAMSGYRADRETECKRRPSRNELRKVLSTQHLQVPPHWKKPATSSLSLPTRVSSRQQQSQQVVAQKPQAIFPPRVIVPSTQVSNLSNQDVVKKIRPHTSRHRVDQPKAHVNKPPSIPGSRDSNVAVLSRAMSKRQTPTTPSQQARKEHHIAPTAEPSLPETKHPPHQTPNPSCIPAKPSTDSPDLTTLTAATKTAPPPPPQPRVKPTATPTTKPSTPSSPPHPPTHSPITPPKLPLSASNLTMPDSKPRQPARADSGASLTQDTSKTNSSAGLDRVKASSDGRVERRSGDELAGWLAISGMLERL